MDLEKNKHLGSKPKAFDKFLEEAYEIHGDKYDYSNFNYKNCKTKGLIHCNKCGTDFYMLPTNHICMKQGCPTCNGTRKYKSDEWIAKCKEKFDICTNNGITLFYYTNLIEKVNNNNFYKDKIIFNDVNNLFKILRDYEATN